MIRRTLFAVAVFFGLCFSVTAQEAPPAAATTSLSLREFGPDTLSDVRFSLGRSIATLDNAYDDLPSLALADRARFAFPSAFAWIEGTPSNSLAESDLQEPPRVRQPARAIAQESSSRPVDLLPKFDYATSEVGIFYGKSTGKYGREVKQGYLLSEIVEGNTHISVGVSYQESTRNTPRSGR